MMFQEQIDLLQQKGLYRSLKTVGYIDRQYIEVENQRCTNYTSNDYLGLGQIAFDKNDFENLCGSIVITIKFKIKWKFGSL